MCFFDRNLQCYFQIIFFYTLYKPGDSRINFIIILTAPDRDRHGCCTGGVTESCDHRLTHASHVGEGIFSGDREVQCVQKFWSDYLNSGLGIRQTGWTIYDIEISQTYRNGPFLRFLKRQFLRIFTD